MISAFACDSLLLYLLLVSPQAVAQAGVQRSKVLINTKFDQLLMARAAALRVLTNHCVAAAASAASSPSPSSSASSSPSSSAPSDEAAALTESYPASDLSADLLAAFAALPSTRRRTRAALMTLAPALRYFGCRLWSDQKR